MSNISSPSDFPNGNGNGKSNGNGKHNGSGRTSYYSGEHVRNGAGASAPKNQNSTNDDEIDLSKLFSVLWRYKFLLAAFLVIGSLGGYIVANSMTPIYRSEGRLLIQEVRNQYSYASSDLNSLMTNAFGVGRGSTIANELAVMRSRSFMDRVAGNIIDIAGDDSETYPIIEATDEEGQPRPATPEEVRMRLLGGVTFERVDQETDVVSIGYESPSPTEAKTVIDEVIDTYNSFSTFENRRMSREGLNFLEQELNEVQEELRRSEEEMRAFMNEEGLVALDEQTSQSIKLLSELETRLSTAQVEKVAAQQAIERYRNELEEIRPGLGEQITKGYGPQVNRLQFAISELQTERELLLSRNPVLREQPELEPRLGDINRRINELEQQVRETVNNLIEQDERFLGLLGSFDGNIITNISELRRNLIELEVKESQLIAQEDVLQEKINQIDATFDRLPDNMTRFARLRRNVELNSELYVMLERQTAEVGIWEQTQSGFGRIVDYGNDPQMPTKPNKKLLLLLGFVLGGVAGLGFVAIREFTSTEISSVEHLQEKGMQVLAVVPDLQRIIKKNFNGQKQVSVQKHSISTDLISFLDPISPPSEAYRRMFNNIIYAQPDNPYRVLICTSAVQGEGKTTTISNLAAITAESGFKTIVIDCDFRRPRLHSEFGLAQDKGVSDWLFSEQELEDVIKPSVIPNVSIITSGRKVPNPANMVQSKRMKELIQELKQRYDYVYIDAPPYGIITDAAPLMRQCDGVILMARFMQTQIGQLDHTVENLNAINANVIGCVLGAYDPKKSTGYGYTESYYKYSYKSYEQYSSQQS